jgi:hypothetical protein
MFNSGCLTLGSGFQIQMVINSKFENSDSWMMQLPSFDDLNFKASDQLEYLSFWFSLVQLILSKFLSNFKVSVTWESWTTQVFYSIWCNLYKSFRCNLYKSFTQIFLVHFIFSMQLDGSCNSYFNAIYIFGSLFFWREYSIDVEFWWELEEGVFKVGEWDQYIAYTSCVCVVEGLYEGCMFEVNFVQLGYLIIC